MMIFVRYSIVLFLHHKLILYISVFMILIPEEPLMKPRENLILLQTFQFMEGKVAGWIQQHWSLVKQEIIRTDIYYHQNHLGLIQNTIKSGIVLDLLILLKENMLRNLAAGYLKSLHRGYQGMMEIYINTF